jgi:hypothetical protein
MDQKKKRRVGALMLGTAIWFTTFGCGDDDDDGPPAAGNHQGGSSTAGVAGRGGGAAGGDAEHGGSAGTTAEGGTDPGSAAGSTVTGGMGGSGAGQGGTPEPSEAGQAGGGGNTAAGGGGNTAAGDGGSSSAGASGNSQAGEQGAGLVDCGGESCDRCCYEMLYDQYPVPPSPEFECVTGNNPPPLCGIDYRFDMTCDAKSDCAEGRVCCMERGTIAQTASAFCVAQCPIVHKPSLYYELCANDEECTAPQHCVKLPNLYFRVCQ